MDVFKLWWYRFALFLYSAFSLRWRVSPSFFFALLMIVAIALLHSDGMSSLLGGSVSCRIFLACGMGLFSGGVEGVRDVVGVWLVPVVGLSS